tara:strand:+ start:1405 stop:1743 length:339 start_codon:yes stop_codon:yes gene_type:complete
MAHQGIREFTSEELSGVALGQNGFKVVTNATVECLVTAGYEDIKYFVALKVIEADADVEARSITVGDDLTLASGGTADFSSPVELVNGDIIYGAFDKIEVASGDYVIAYIGR